MARNAMRIFIDPPSVVHVMKRRGYGFMSDRATGTLFHKLDKLVHMVSDGDASALTCIYLPGWCADRVLAEASDGKAVQR
jgi:hypothetical protein